MLLFAQLRWVALLFLTLPLLFSVWLGFGIRKGCLAAAIASVVSFLGALVAHLFYPMEIAPLGGHFVGLPLTCACIVFVTRTIAGLIRWLRTNWSRKKNERSTPEDTGH
jgi:hypothetical protein